MTDEDVIEHLTQVKGIGVWTAHMFLMFSLRRPNVLPTGDYGIQVAMKKHYKKRKLPKPKDMEKIARAWAPYRSVACWYLWRSLDIKTVRLQAPWRIYMTLEFQKALMLGSRYCSGRPPFSEYPSQWRYAYLAICIFYSFPSPCLPLFSLSVIPVSPVVKCLAMADLKIRVLVANPVWTGMTAERR